jgi:hypothetical protein
MGGILMPTKKKQVKETPDNQVLANTNAIGALTEIAASTNLRLQNLEDNMKSINTKLRQVLSRLGL